MTAPIRMRPGPDGQNTITLRCRAMRIVAPRRKRSARACGPGAPGQGAALNVEDVGVLVGERGGIAAVTEEAESADGGRVRHLGDRAGIHVDVGTEIGSRATP